MLHEPQFPRAWFSILHDSCRCNLVFAEVRAQCMCDMCDMCDVDVAQSWSS